jgi:hypothetical protein
LYYTYSGRYAKIPSLWAVVKDKTEASLQSIVGKVFDIVEIVVYEEMENDDSLHVSATV